MLKRLRRWFITGLILVAPAFVTAVAVAWVFDHIDSPAREAIAHYTGVDIPGLGLLITLLVVLLAGAAVSQYAIRSVVQSFERLLDRIPLVRTLYSGVKQLIAPFGDEKANTFQSVVVVEFPHPGMYSLGFLIKPNAATTKDGVALSAVLVPTNHLHLGNVVLARPEQIHAVDLSAEEGLKFLVSMGAALERPMLLGKHELPNP